VIKAARKVDTGIVDIETNELWERVKMHGVNFDRYLGKKTGGGLEKYRQELQAENEGVVFPLAINWIGGPKDVQKKKAEGKKASSVVFAVKGSKMAENVLKGGLRAAGVKYDVEKFMNARPDSFCGVCSRWGHVEAKCGSLKMPACMLCVGRHLTKDHKCNVVGCKANAGQNCTHFSKKHFRPGGMAPSEWTRSVRAVRDTLVADYSAPGVNTTRHVAHRPSITVSPFLPHTLQEHSQILLKAPAVMEVHSGCYEICLLG